MVMDSVSKEEVSVADTMLDIWELVNKILQQQTLLESWMKGGYMNIAKARQVPHPYFLERVGILCLLCLILPRSLFITHPSYILPSAFPSLLTSFPFLSLLRVLSYRGI